MRRGVVLVQVLLGLALLGVLLPGLLSLLGAGDRDLTATVSMGRAVEAAQLVMEECCRRGFLMEHLGQRLHLPQESDAELALPREFVERDHGEAWVTVGVVPRQTNPVTGLDESDLVEVRVEVCWTEAGEPRSFRLATRRALLEEPR